MISIRSLAPFLLPATVLCGCSRSESAPAHAFQYALDLAVTEGSATKHTAFTLDVSDRTPGSVTVGKNVTLGGGARSDVGVTLTGHLEMEGDTPRLEIDATISSLDAAGKIRRMKGHGVASIVPGGTGTLLEGSEDGISYRLTATPSAGPPLEASIPSTRSSAPYVLDVVATQSRGGPPSKRTAMSLTLAGNAPSTVRTGETVPLTVTNAGVIGTPRQDTGTRVKATARPHREGLDLDFDLELSAVEPGSPGATIRKLRAHGPVLAVFDKPTTAFVAEEDGTRYEVTVTPHRK